MIKKIKIESPHFIPNIIIPMHLKGCKSSLPHHSKQLKHVMFVTQRIAQRDIGYVIQVPDLTF